MSSSERTWPGQQSPSTAPRPPEEGAWQRPAAGAGQQHLAPRDREVLEFAAAHPFIHPDHIKALLGDTALLVSQRLRALTQAGLLSSQPAFHDQPDSYQITQQGLEAIDSQLPIPRWETVRSYRHQYGVAFLVLAAQANVWGEIDRALTQRQMRALDNTTETYDHVFSTPADHRHPPFGVQLDPERPDMPKHYPDMILIDPGARVAVELQLLPPAPARLEAVIAAYGADPKTSAALYLVNNQTVGKTIQAAAANLGLSAPTHVQRAQFGANPPAEIAR
jgi:hypothetical protein